MSQTAEPETEAPNEEPSEEEQPGDDEEPGDEEPPAGLMSLASTTEPSVFTFQSSSLCTTSLAVK